MMDVIDYYDYWYAPSHVQQKGFLPREREALKLIRSLTLSPTTRFLDAGCGTGDFMRFLEKKKSFSVFGLEYSKDALRICKEKGLSVQYADLNVRIPFPDHSFDLVYAGEVLEHLYDPDTFLEEVRRILKKGGYLVITTPNLCNWYNRLLFLFGIQPVFIETSTRNKMVGASILKRLKPESQPVGHVRIFTYAAFQDLLELSGFKIIQKSAAAFEHFPRRFFWIDRFFTLFPRLGSEIVAVARAV